MKDICEQSVTARVSKRHVFFVPGYDPIGARRYRELYRTHSVQQAEISGYEISMTGKPGRAAYSWEIDATIEGAQVQTHYEVLSWGDIVRDSMTANIAQTYLLMLKTLWLYLSSGALLQLFRLRPIAMIAALYPVFMLTLQASTAFALGLAAFMLFQPVSALVSSIVAAATFIGALIVFKRMDGPLFAYYLMHDYAFSAKLKGRIPPELKTQLGTFQTRISDALNSDADEVLIVGHSSGAHLAVTIVADILRAQSRAKTPAQLSLLTLGQVIPMISFLPNAQELRGDLNMLSKDSRIVWVDVSAPGDGGSFALSDPVHVTGVAPPEPEKLWPKVLSAKFTLTLSPETLRRTKWRFFRRHVQYLCTFDQPQEYDYFRITAGPYTLEDRFAWRGATKSRIETALSLYRDF